MRIIITGKTPQCKSYIDDFGSEKKSFFVKALIKTIVADDGTVELRFKMRADKLMKQAGLPVQEAFLTQLSEQFRQDGFSPVEYDIKVIE